MARLRTGDETRQHRTHPFVAVPNSTIRDTRLSLRARGLLALLLSQSDDWVFSMEWLGRQTETGVDEDGNRLPGEGREAMSTALRELRKHGYYRVERRHMLRDGTFRTGGYVRDEPDPEWVVEYAAACAAGQTKSPRWDCIVRVLPDGTVEEEARRPGDTPPTGTDGDDLDAERDNPPGPRKPVTGHPVPENPVTGSPGDRTTGDLKKNNPEEHLEEGVTSRGDAYVSRGDDLEPPLEAKDLPVAAVAADGPPPDRCATHAPWPPARTVPACGACGDARRARAEWAHREDEQAREGAAAERERQLMASRLRDSAEEACRLCDDTGTAVVSGESMACRHDAALNERAKAAQRAAREALRDALRQRAS